MTCTQVAVTLTSLGLGGIGIIIFMDMVTVHGGRLRFRSIQWRIAWWASWISLLVGVVLWAFFCGSSVMEARLT